MPVGIFRTGFQMAKMYRAGVVNLCFVINNQNLKENLVTKVLTINVAEKKYNIWIRDSGVDINVLEIGNTGYYTQYSSEVKIIVKYSTVLSRQPRQLYSVYILFYFIF